MHQYTRESLLCFRCGISGHKSIVCPNAPISYLEQSYLKQMIYDDMQKLQSTGPGILIVQGNMAHLGPVSEFEYDLQNTLPRSNLKPFPDMKEKSDLNQNDESSLASHQGKIQVELEDGTLEKVDLLSYLDVAEIKRRQMQVEKSTEDMGPEASKDNSADTRKKLTPKGKSTGKKKKTLAQIVGMIGELEIDMRKVLMGTNVVLPLLQQMQISP